MSMRIPQAYRQVKLVMQLSSGAQCNFKKTKILALVFTSASFYNVFWYRNHSSSHLKV